MTGSAPMSAAPDIALTSTSLASCNAPTAKVSTPLTVPRSTGGTYMGAIAFRKP